LSRLLQQNSTLRLQLKYDDFLKALKGKSLSNAFVQIIDFVSIDSRKISIVEQTAFFCLRGARRDGHDYIPDAYERGIRLFVVAMEEIPTGYGDAAFVSVDDTLLALQRLATEHRAKFSYPVVGITGSAGKTTVKEWIHHLLPADVRVLRSPKSYNSQIGVPLSLLELHEDCDLALIEAGISQPGEMEVLENMIRPDYGVFTSFGRAHEEHFSSLVEHLDEKLQLFRRTRATFVSEKIPLSSEQLRKVKGKILRSSGVKKELSHLPFQDAVSQSNATVAIGFVKSLLPNVAIKTQSISTLPRLALRMETFEGIFGNTIINDTYNLDLDALSHALEYQLLVAGDRPRVVIIGLDEDNFHRRSDVEQIVRSFHPQDFQIISSIDEPLRAFRDSVILIKGTRKLELQRLAKTFRLKNHKTYVEIDLSALKSNVQVFRNELKPSTKVLAMVKAQSYGSGAEEIAGFLEQQGVDYLGVAYADEGVELRKKGVKLPILVMNSEEEGFEACIEHHLEPAIYSLRQLDEFIRELLNRGEVGHPIHLKIDTGMNRLGFTLEQLRQALTLIQAQPEVRVSSLYTHMAESDNRRDKRFTDAQVKRFMDAGDLVFRSVGYAFHRHMLNSEGVFNHPDMQFDMIRLGIGMYGVSSHPQFRKKLRPVISWRSTVSQIRDIKKGDSVGYSRSFIAGGPMKIAVIPVGYADGFRRSLSNGKGGVYINEKFCATVGKVCMDMIMVDVTGVSVNEGDLVEIIGKHQSIEQLAERMDTIPYEVMTGISRRVHRIYLEE
jgi:alanine racemase